jgi:hypothetical protein
MKNQIRMALLLVLAFLFSGCTNTSQAVSPGPATEQLAVEDKASLIAALEAAGATVELGEPISQPFFTPEGSIVKVNGADVQIFEYESSEEMGNEASQVSADGGAIGTSMVTWMDTPHFYKTGRIIVLYIGSDAAVLDLLERVLGPQFAGQ